jgi:hypothetical protein
MSEPRDLVTVVTGLCVPPAAYVEQYASDHDRLLRGAGGR